METKISEFRGYTITYDSRNKEFILRNREGDTVGSGKTQEDVEEQAEKLKKQTYKFPLEAFHVSGLSLYPGRITSINLSDHSVWFVPKTEDAHRSKEHLSYSHIYQATEKNNKIAADISSKHSHIKALEKEIRELITDLEKPLDLRFFGLPETY